MFKKIAALALCALLGFTMIGCGGGNSDVVKVGWIGSLTGDQAVWGTCESQTVQMFFEEINANGGLLGKQVEVVAQDTKGDATEAVTVVKRLTTQDKVIGIIGPNASGQAIPLSPVLEETKVCDIATVATNEKVTVNDDGTVKPYNFRICFIDAHQGSVAAGFSYDVLNAKNAAILYDVGDDYSQGISQVFEDYFTQKGGTIVAKEAFKTGDVEFRAQLTKIKNANPDVIFMPFAYKEVALSAKQARELGITATLIGTDTWPSEQLLEMAAAEVEGSYYVNHLDFADPDVQDLKNKYKEKYGKEPEINAYLAWDACTMLVEAVKKAGSFDLEAIQKAMTETNFKGLTGQIVIGADTHNPENKDAAMIQIKDGGYVFAQKYRPE